jgi:Protein of unknown function (DUF2384)
MALRPNGTGLAHSEASSNWTALMPRNVQHEATFGTAGLAPGIAANLPPMQPANVRSGVIDAFVKTCQRWHLPLEQQVILLGYKGSEFFGLQLLEGRVLAPPQDVQDRAGYILAISIGLSSLFDELERAELDWLNTPRDVLSGRSALAYMLDGRMANLMHVAAMVDRERGM